MDEDQDFETFLREWAKERIWPTDDALLQHFLAKARAIELIQLAVARGFPRRSGKDTISEGHPWHFEEAPACVPDNLLAQR